MMKSWSWREAGKCRSRLVGGGPTARISVGSVYTTHNTTQHNTTHRHRHMSVYTCRAARRPRFALLPTIHLIPITYLLALSCRR
jgi:hypothetical protein